MPKEGSWIRTKLPNGGLIEHEYHAPVLPVLADEKLIRITQVKTESAQRISALNWKIERADDRDLLGGDLRKTLRKSIAQERENIRLASNTAELDITALTTIDEVNNFKW